LEATVEYDKMFKEVRPDAVAAQYAKDGSLPRNRDLQVCLFTEMDHAHTRIYINISVSRRRKKKKNLEKKKKRDASTRPCC
jgi:hypothetical protein